MSTDLITLRWNLCDPSRDVGGYRFNCADKTDPQTWPCTGSEHPDKGVELLCTCECHSRPLHGMKVLDGRWLE